MQARCRFRSHLGQVSISYNNHKVVLTSNAEYTATLQPLTAAHSILTWTLHGTPLHVTTRADSSKLLGHSIFVTSTTKSTRTTKMSGGYALVEYLFPTFYTLDDIAKVTEDCFHMYGTNHMYSPPQNYNTLADDEDQEHSHLAQPTVGQPTVG
eukprot:5801503-Prymnesium_polylepis.1